MTETQKFIIERKAGTELAREAIMKCQWRCVRPKKEDPVGCTTCSYFDGKICPFRKFLAARSDEKAWVSE